MERELKEYVSDFKEALELLNEATFEDNHSIFKRDELLFRQKKRDREGFEPGMITQQEYDELEESMERAQDEASEYKNQVYDLIDDIRTVLKNY